MTTLVAEASASTALEPTVGQRLARWRRPLLIVLILLIGAVVLGIVRSQHSEGYLDPHGTDSVGSRALASILEDDGIGVSIARTTSEATAAASAGATMLVTYPDLLVADQIEQVTATGADLVLVQADATLEDFAPHVEVSSSASSSVRAASCDHPAAEMAGSAYVGGVHYDAATASAACYQAAGDEGAPMLVSSAGEYDVILLGSGDFMTNSRLDEEGNAALAMNLLGGAGELTWYVPTPEAAYGGDQSFIELLPGWVWPVVTQLVIAVGFAAWWRARRFGPLVAEPLPAVVQANEVTHGRAGLYRSGKSRAHVAQILRDATSTRLRQRLGVPAGDDVDALVAVVAARTDLDEAKVYELLAGDVSTNDSALVTLANDLSTLESRATNSR